MNEHSKNFNKKTLKNGKPNTKYVDLLEVDKSLAGQNFGCYSFISPDKILKQKEMFFFEEFLKKWDMSKSMEKFTQFLNFISYKYKMSFEHVIKDYELFIKEEKSLIDETSLLNDYKTFLDHNENELDKQFNIKHNFQTSVKGFKSRGNFDTQEEAEMRAKILREVDPNFDIFVGPVGQWLCWDPEAYKTGKVEYMEEELNQLAHEKHKNESAAKTAFEARVRESKEKAIEDNKKNAELTGNVLTQNIDKDGNLVDVNTENTNNTENNSISVADIRSELFEGNNIVVGQNNHGIDELKNNPFNIKND